MEEILPDLSKNTIVQNANFSLYFVYKKVYNYLKKNEFSYDFNSIFMDNNFNLLAKKSQINDTFYFIIKNKNSSKILYESEELLFKPFILYFYSNNSQDSIKYIIVSKVDFLNKIKENNLKNPIFFCSYKNLEKKAKFSLIYQHYDCKGCHYIKEEFFKETFDQKSFSDFFKKYENFKQEYSLPNDFESNYKYYFSYYDYTKNKYKIYLNHNRSSLISDFEDSKIGKLNIFYGSPGKGKSITLLIFLKYNLNLNDWGVLYINCKTLYNLYKANDFYLFKKILFNELIFLFKNDLKHYNECIKSLNNVKFENDTFWNIISNLIKYLKDFKKKYTIAFDQYKARIDPKGDLIKIKNIINNKFRLIVCCSLNDKDIKKMKIKNLFKTFDYMNDLYENIIYNDIEDIFDISKFKIDDEGIYDKIFEKIGKTIKNYNILTFIYNNNNNENELNNFLNENKEKIKNNLLNFFDLGNNTIEKTYSIFTFSVGFEYDQDYIKNNIDNLSFKYFDIKLDNNNKTGFIKYRFPLIEEIMVELYNYVISKNSQIYMIFKKGNILPRNSLGGLFEKFVIYKINPLSNDEKKVILFNYFIITKNEKVPKFLPNKNEEFYKKTYKKKNLDDGTYLFEQEIFGGKSFDVGIIQLDTKSNIQNSKVFLFQISIHKNKIFKIDELQQYINTFIEYFSFLYSFTIKKENVYFSYIFEIENKEKKTEYKMNKIPFIYYSVSNNIFLDKNLKEINSINNIFICPATYNLLHIENNNDKFENNNEQKYSIFNGVKKKIIDIIRSNKYFNISNYINVQFLKNTNSKNTIFQKNYMFLREIKNLEKEHLKTLLNSYNFSYKNLYLIIFKFPFDEIKQHLILYYNQKNINQIKIDKYSEFSNNSIFDLYEITENNDEDKFIEESQNSILD